MGSEMCIRDRSSRNRRHSASRWSTQARNVHQASSPRFATSPHGTWSRLAASFHFSGRQSIRRNRHFLTKMRLNASKIVQDRSRTVSVPFSGYGRRIPEMGLRVHRNLHYGSLPGPWHVATCRHHSVAIRLVKRNPRPVRDRAPRSCRSNPPIISGLPLVEVAP